MEVLIGQSPHPGEPAWFWSEEWQAMEREADGELAAGHSSTFGTAAGLLAHLEQIDAAVVEGDGSARGHVKLGNRRHVRS
jgi:hypothetical protein